MICWLMEEVWSSGMTSIPVPRRRAVLVVSLLVVVFLAASLVAALATTTSLSCLWSGDCSTSHSR